jgi:hypothetical protein
MMDLREIGGGGMELIYLAYVGISGSVLFRTR